MTELFHAGRDRNVDCDSVLVSMLVGDFLSMVDVVYKSKGGIDGQRPALKSKTAKTIRSRLVRDVSLGAIVPPIVIGIFADKTTRSSLAAAENAQSFLSAIGGIDQDRISIIDGMQRTTAFMEACEHDKNVLNENIRVEFWVSENLSSLVYRMLVLNSGQVPWETARQLETVYSQLILLLKKRSGNRAAIFLKDEGRRRSTSGQYQASTAIRLYLSFSARRAEFDIKDRVAEDFARLDAIESSSHSEFIEYFQDAFDLLLRLDLAFSNSLEAPKPHSDRIADGREMFKAEPALVGFVVAISLKLFNDPGFEPKWEEAKVKMQEISKGMTEFTDRLLAMSPAEVTEFLQLDILNERLNQRSGQVGRFERELFVRSFSMLVDRHRELQSMEPCWLK